MRTGGCRNFYRRKILKEYVSYVAGRISLSAWVDGAVEKMNTLRKLDPLSEMYQLYQANIYLLGTPDRGGKVDPGKLQLQPFAIGKDPITQTAITCI